MAKEMRLIDSEPIKKFIVAGINCSDRKRAFGYDAIQILAEIEFAPTVDAVSIVRCKDCKHWRWSENNLFGRDYGTCVECLMDTQEEHFCAYGERRSNGKTD